MKDTMRSGTAACGSGPRRCPKPVSWTIARLVDTDDVGVTTPPLIDPLDDRDGRC